MAISEQVIILILPYLGPEELLSTGIASKSWFNFSSTVRAYLFHGIASISRWRCWHHLQLIISLTLERVRLAFNPSWHRNTQLQNNHDSVLFATSIWSLISPIILLLFLPHNHIGFSMERSLWECKLCFFKSSSWCKEQEDLLFSEFRWRTQTLPDESWAVRSQGVGLQIQGSVVQCSVCEVWFYCSAV